MNLGLSAEGVVVVLGDAGFFVCFVSCFMDKSTSVASTQHSTRAHTHTHTHTHTTSNTCETSLRHALRHNVLFYFATQRLLTDLQHKAELTQRLDAPSVNLAWSLCQNTWFCRNKADRWRAVVLEPLLTHSAPTDVTPLMQAALIGADGYNGYLEGSTERLGGGSERIEMFTGWCYALYFE